MLQNIIVYTNSKKLITEKLEGGVVDVYVYLVSLKGKANKAGKKSLPEYFAVKPGERIFKIRKTLKNKTFKIYVQK